MKKFNIDHSEYWGEDEGVFTLYVGQTEDIKAVYKSLMRNARNERSTSKLCPVFTDPARFSDPRHPFVPGRKPFLPRQRSVQIQTLLRTAG